MAILSWDEAKGMVGYDDLSQDQKVAEADKYSQYVQRYYSEVDPQDPKIVGESVGKFIDNEAQNVLGDLDAYQRTKQFFGQIGKGAGEAASLSMRGIAVAQQVIGETMNQYDDNSPVAERDLYKMGEDIDARVKDVTGVEDPRLRGSLINSMLPNALGNALGFAAASTVAAGVATGAVAAAGASIPAVVGAGIVTGATALAAGGLGSAMEAGSLYQEAKQYGADEGTARLAAAAGVPIGATEAIPFAGLGKRLLLGTAEKMGVDVLSGSMKAWSKGLGKETIGSIAAKTALEEGGQEGFQQFLENATAKTLYDPSRGLMDNVATSALVGGIVGAGLGGGVQAITRDNEYFYAQGLGNELAQQADLAASLTPERITQINQAAQNAFTTTEQKINLESGETTTTESKKGVFGDRKAGDVPDIGNNPAINSYPLGSRTSQDENGINTETMTFHTPQGLLWEAEFKSGEPVKVRDVTDTSPLLGGITNPADPKTATRSQFTGRIISPTSSLASEFGLETEQEMDRRLISEAQQDAFLGRSPNQTRTPDNQVITNPIARDDLGVARQDVLKQEIDRLYRIREAVLAKQILVGENPAEGTPDQRSNTAKSVTTYDSNGKPVDQKAETSKRVGKLNRMIGQREVELRGLTARPEGYILASDRQSPPSESQKASLVQGFQKVWESITSPEMRNAINFEVGDITPLIESGQVPRGAVAYYQRAIKGRKAMVFLSDRLASLPLARREMLHELGHAFYDTLPLGVQIQIRNLWKGETESRTGALFDEYGALLQEVSPRVMDSVQEFFSERMAWTNDHWAKGMTEQNKLMDQVGRAFRSMVDKFMRYTGHGERLNLEFRAFLDQGDRFTGLRRRINQIAQTAAMSTNAGDINREASVRGLTGAEDIQPKKERVATTGQYVGLPEVINTPEKLQDLQDKLEVLAFEGEAGRFWYEKSSEEIMRMVGGNIKDAEMLVSFISVFSPQNRVYPNWGQALRAYAQYKRGETITQGKTGRDIERGRAVANGERWLGLKTNNFYHNLMIRIDPAQTVKGATVDMWIMRVFGYDSDSPSDTQYAAAENVIKAIAKKMGWEPQQVQAAIWVAGKAKWEEIIWPEIKAEAKSRGDLAQVTDEDGKKKWQYKSSAIAKDYRAKAMGRVFDKLNVDINESAKDFSDMAKRNLATVSMETRFGLTTNERWQDSLSAPQLLQYHQQKEQILTDRYGINIVLREFGVPMDNMYNAVGLWKSQTNPLTQIEVPSYRDTGSKRFAADKNIKANLDDAISALGLLLKQDGMAYHQPYFDAQVKESNGVEFRFGRQTTAEETSKLSDAFNGAYAIVNVRDGFRVLKFDDSMDNVAFHKLAKANVIQIFGDNEVFEMDRFAFDGNLIENDWSKNPNGENYRSRIKESGRSDILRGIEDNLVPQIERLDSYWRGIAESSGRAGSQSAGGQSTGTGQVAQGRGIQKAGSPEVRASTRGQTRSIIDKDDKILYHYTNIGRNFGRSELEGKTAREALLYIISKEKEKKSDPTRRSFLNNSSSENIDLQKWNKQYDKTISIATMLAQSEFDNLDTDKMERGYLGDRAYRSAMGYIGFGYNGINLGVLVHEIAHTITADQIRKYTMRPSTMDSGSYAKQIRAALASSETPEPIKRIIRLYQSTLKQLNLTDQYLDGIKYQKDPNSVYVSMAVSNSSQRAKNDMGLPSGLKISLSLMSTDGRSSTALKKAILSNHRSLFPDMRSFDVGKNPNALGDVALYIPEDADLASAMTSIIGGDPNGTIIKSRVFDQVRKAMLGGGGFAISSSSIAEVEVGGGRAKIKPISNNNADRTIRAGGDYALGNLDEFIAEAFSNGAFQEILATLDGDQKSSLWRDLVEAIANLLGITDTSMMASVMDATFEIAEMSNKKAANIVDVSDVQASTRGDQAQRLLEPVFSFGRQQLRTGGALPNDIFRITEQRGFSVNEKLLRAQNAVNDLESAVKRVMGKSFDKLSADEVKKINDAMQNPALRASLPTDIAAAVGNARNLIDSLTQDLLRSGAISEQLQPILEANKGVYLHRSYEKWENPNYKNPFNTLPKQVQSKLITTVTSFLHNKYANAYAKEQSLLRGEPAIDRESGVYQADVQAGLTKARSGGVTKAEVNGQIEYLAAPETDSPFGQIGSGLTKDLSIITARKDIPEEIRMLWGEIKDPRVNFLKSVQKMAGFLETHNMLKNMKDAGMNKIFFTTPRTGFTTKLVSDGSRTSSPLNMFVEGMSNEVYTSEEIATALRNTFGTRARPQDFIGKLGELYLKANGFTKFAKTVLSVQTQVRNVLGNASFLVANGYIFSPDGFTAINKLRTLALPSAGTQLGLNKSKEFRDYNAKLTRLGILGQSVFANEMESYFKDANMGTAADFFDNHVTKVLKTIGRGATNAYQLGDAIPKIVAFEVELSRLRRAYPNLPLSKLEPMAADKVLNLLPTYSRIPRLGNVLRSQPFVGAFISFPLEVLRTGYNLIGTINEELRSDNPAIRQSGAYRLVGTLIASVGFSAAASAVASAMGIDDDEDKDIRKLDAPWDKYATKLYLGRDAKGNIQQVNLSYVDPYNYLRDPILALVKADGSWDQKLMEAVKTGFEPLFGEQMLAGKILDISRNKKGTTGGRVYNPEGDIASKAMSVSAHMFDAFNIGTLVSADRVYKGLTGQVSQTGRAYDPALEAIATVTGQRVVTLDMAQSLGFAARRFSSRLNDATGIFTAAYYDKSKVDESARLNAYKEMVSARTSIFSDTGGLVSAVMRLGLSRGEVMMVLKEQGISAENARALTTGTVSAYRPAKLGQRMDANRFRQQTTAR